MIVVPLTKDIIETKDGAKYRVVEYTNYKDGGPAVYAKSKNKEIVLIYFFDINSINDTHVEYQKSSKVFIALGKIERIEHLPQPDDKIKVMTRTLDGNSREDHVEVTGFKLKSKNVGINKGLVVKGDDHEYYRLKNIIDIDRSIGSDYFNRKVFLEYYKDYLGV